MDQTGHRSMDMVRRYTRDSESLGEPRRRWLAVGGNAMNELFGLQGTIIFGFAMVLYWIGRLDAHIAL